MKNKYTPKFYDKADATGKRLNPKKIAEAAADHLEDAQDLMTKCLASVSVPCGESVGTSDKHALEEEHVL